MKADPSNADQLGGWDGPTGEYWAAHADRYDAGVAAYQGPLLDAAAIGPADAVLDVGCGAGQVTRDAARRATAGSALGIDLSIPMLDLARGRAEREGIANATFEQADAQVHPFPAGRFDVVVSRHGSMFFGDPRAAFTNIARALRPGGRLVLLTWQPFARQEWISSFFAALDAGRGLAAPPPGMPGPFGLSDPDQVREILTSAGFADVRLAGVEKPMDYGPDPDDAASFVAGQFVGLVDTLDAGTRAAALDRLRAVMAEHRTERGVQFDSSCWLVEAK
jgi:SAM-dependent methyltransferase